MRNHLSGPTDDDDDNDDDDDDDNDEEYDDDEDEEHDDDDDDEPIILYRMRCIWEGRLDILWNALQLRRMLDTIHYWALQKYRTDIDSDIRRRLRKYRPTSNRSTPSSFRQAEEQGHFRTSPSPLANKRGNRPARPALDNTKSPSTLVRQLEELDVNSAPLEFESSPRRSKKIATRG
ncbi:hypothetical protein IFM46972_03876 [Aspergillus udagawae]|uniref:Uncharacterized protein n=1 Tax=Aspergillus udagawae TaxID=91492 RepID=A0A8H3RN90_9EURO|nr:hypothetical protein IFM46972_03876 [Aspergillus udagawae]